MVDMQAGLRRYLNFVMEDNGLSASALAKQAGVAATTLTRFLNDKKHKFTLSTTTVEKISAATGSNPAPFLDGSDAAEFAATVLGQDRFSANITIAHTIGETQPGVWLEIPTLEIIKFDVHTVTATGYQPKNVFYLKVKGKSCDMFAKEGEYLQCIRTEEYLLHQKFQHRALVAIERRSADQSLIEITARLISSAAGGGYDLTFLSEDPEILKIENLHIRSFDDQQAGVKVIGFVHCAIRYLGSRF